MMIGSACLVACVGVVVSLVGLQAEAPPDAVVFAHADEVVKGDGFLVVADRRMFAAMAFLNASGFDDEAKGQAMHPVRARVRKLVESALADKPEKLASWRDTYRKSGTPIFRYMDFALSLSADYPFKRIQPITELTYPQTAWTLRDFPDQLDDFWVAAGLEKIWNEVKPDYVAELRPDPRAAVLRRPRRFREERQALRRVLARSARAPAAASTLKANGRAGEYSSDSVANRRGRGLLATGTADRIQRVGGRDRHGISNPQRRRRATMSDDRRCPKCDEAMEEGHFIDFTDTGRWPSMWVRVADAGAVWMHTNRNTKGFYASAFRCVACGFLEQYAIHKAPIGNGEHA
ncbi:MAG: hypothetical protein HYR85_15615 [Planctomycetes bacterium]|nr:hypothetical protein [Planctomycetota bacterium]MBI3848139.1 hypothetical protein [Planctomycetota bacterium]